MSKASMPVSAWMRSRMPSVHGSAPNTPVRSGRSLRSTPISPAFSTRCTKKLGVAHTAVTPKSRISMIWRSVLPPETGITAAPIASAP